MYRRLQIDVLDDFHAALVSIQHAINSQNSPTISLNEFKSRVTAANDSFVAMAISECWESVNCTLKALNYAIDFMHYIDSFEYTPEINKEWHAHYQNASMAVNRIYSKLYDVSVKEYALF